MNTQNINITDLHLNVIKDECIYGYGYTYRVSLSAKVNGELMRYNRVVPEIDARILHEVKRDMVTELLMVARDFIDLECNINIGSIAK